MTYPHVLSGIGVGNGLNVGDGAGVSAAETCVNRVTAEGDLVITEIFVDLTGLDVNAAGDIIGNTGASAAYIGQWTVAQCGTFCGGKIECLELPAGGDPDIDLYSAVEATGTEDAPITGLTETALIDAGDHAANAFKSLTAGPADGEYLYLVAGAGATVFAAYTGGKLKITLYGKK